MRVCLDGKIMGDYINTLERTLATDVFYNITLARIRPIRTKVGYAEEYQRRQLYLL